MEGVIRSVGSIIDIPDGVATIDCRGGLVLPGFIDVHSHGDGRIWDQDLSLPKVRQGVTTEVVGNCGLGPAPTPRDSKGWRSLLAGIGIQGPEDWFFDEFSEFSQKLMKTNASHWPRVMTLLPYGAVRVSVAGVRRHLSSEDMDRLRSEIDRALHDGALGVSLGLAYPPSDSATEQELLTALQPIARHRSLLSVHIRSQANYWIEAIDEVLRLAQALGVKLLISHLCVGGEQNQWKLEWVAARLSEARRQGIDVWFDQHPYSAGSTSLTQLFPTWAVETGSDGIQLAVKPSELADLLKSPSIRPGWENYLNLVGPENVLISGSTQAPELIGKTIADIESETGGSLAGALVKILRECSGDATVVLTNLYHQEGIELLMKLPFGCISTDGLNVALPHPRLYGTYPYAFARFVRTGIMSESEFVERSARRPAQIARLTNTGGILPGSEANLVVIDPGTFGHTTDYLHPDMEVEGMRHLVLGGEVFSPLIAKGEESHAMGTR